MTSTALNSAKSFWDFSASNSKTRLICQVLTTGDWLSLLKGASVVSPKEPSSMSRTGYLASGTAILWSRMEMDALAFCLLKS